MEKMLLIVDTAGLALALTICWRMLSVFEGVLKLYREIITSLVSMSKDIEFNKERIASIEERCNSLSK